MARVVNQDAPSGEAGQSPYLLAILLVMVATAIFGLNKVSPLFAPGLLAASILGMIVVAVRQWRSDRAQAEALDYTKLAAIDLTSFGPWLKENVRGQDEAVDSILAQLQANLGLATSGRTLGAFFWWGRRGREKHFLANWSRMRSIRNRSRSFCG